MKYTVTLKHLHNSCQYGLPGGRVRQVNTVEGHGPGTFRYQSRNRVHQGAFSSTVTAENNHKLSGAHIHRQAVHDFRLAIGNMQIND